MRLFLMKDLLQRVIFIFGLTLNEVRKTYNKHEYYVLNLCVLFK